VTHSRPAMFSIVDVLVAVMKGNVSRLASDATKRVLLALLFPSTS